MISKPFAEYTFGDVSGAGTSMQSERVGKYTSKQMGDACEMLVAAELTLAGVPALRVPDFWPGYDVIAQPRDSDSQRIQVKSRTYKAGGGTFVTYLEGDKFDWLAVVLLPSGTQKERRIFVIPRAFADSKARRDKPTSKTAAERYWRIDEIEKFFGAFEQNFLLNEQGNELPGVVNMFPRSRKS